MAETFFIRWLRSFGILLGIMVSISLLTLIGAVFVQLARMAVEHFAGGQIDGLTGYIASVAIGMIALSALAALWDAKHNA